MAGHVEVSVNSDHHVIVKFHESGGCFTCIYLHGRVVNLCDLIRLLAVVAASFSWCLDVVHLGV